MSTKADRKRTALKLVTGSKPKSKLKGQPSTHFHVDVEQHEEGSPICILHTAFDDAGFYLDTCSCPDKVCRNAGFGIPDDVSFSKSIEMFRKVRAAIQDVPQLAKDVKFIDETILDVHRTGGFYLYKPKSLKLIVTEAFDDTCDRDVCDGCLEAAA